jgi:hypothetical protein
VCLWFCGSGLRSWEESEEGEAEELEPKEVVEREASHPSRNATDFRCNAAVFLAVATELPSRWPPSVFS